MKKKRTNYFPLIILLLFFGIGSAVFVCQHLRILSYILKMPERFSVIRAFRITFIAIA